MNDHDDDDKPCLPGKGKKDVSDKTPMKKGAGKGPSGGKLAGGGKMGHEVHHKNMPHGMTGPACPDGYCK